ncbi:hypothetical protein ALC60_08182 [Trachymyrmex zeteki]|uniref:Uncharacterized protein n=1 Tax=Mycetomoellerius zeteki TaxID=64791 RepID=A0A151WXU1_9HYME|nr:hypothetical protein ALC60_08182 [Trachymyrmex zeteki]
MVRHAKRLIGMLLLRPRCINCAATTLEYTMHFDPSHTTLFGVVAYVASAKWVNLIYRGGNMYVDIDDETPTPLRFLGSVKIVSIMFVPEVQPFLARNVLHEERLLLFDAMEYLCLKPGQHVFENFTNYLIARQSTPISGYSVCTIKRCASQMRAVAREVFILRGVCSVIKRTGKRRQRVFRRYGKPPRRKKVDRHEKRRTTSKSQSIRYLFSTLISIVFNRDDRFVERLRRSCSHKAAFRRQETKSEVSRVCSELSVHPQMCNVNTRTNIFDFVCRFVAAK